VHIFPLPYMPHPRGHEPDLSRPLRNEPVRRDEVRIYRRLGERRVTMPPDTYRIEDRGKYRRQYLVGDPVLWQPLMDELASQYAEEHEYWRRRGLTARTEPLPLPKLEIRLWSAVEYTCEQCGAQFLDGELAGNMIRLCSDKCERERTAARQRQWRETTSQPRPAARRGPRWPHLRALWCGDRGDTINPALLL
jgi:hypothetical protein